MPQDPRNRISVGIDGRQYVRKSVYVDVLGIPTITDAVRAASEMLRRGIVHAMSTIPEDEAAALGKQARVERQKPSQQAQAPTSAADRHPVSVYTDAIAKRPRKPTTPDVAEKKNNELDSSPVVIVKEKMAGDTANSGSRAWSSAKKAGPSILTKRSRPQSSAPGSSSGSERVFQPALKREKRTELEKKQALLSAAVQSRAPIRTKDTGISQSAPKSLTPAPRSAALRPSSQRPAAIQTPRADLKPSISLNASGSVVRSKPTSSVSSVSLQGKMHQKRAPETVAQRLLRNIAKKESATESARSLSSRAASGPMLLHSQKQAKPLSSLRSPAARKLPASWTQVTFNGVNKGSTGRVSTLQKTSGIRKPGSGSSLSKGAGSSASASKGGNFGNKFTAEQLLMLRNRTEGLPPARSLTQSKLGSDGIVPLPSTSGLHILYVPGSETINGVRPNGYTVARDGTVKPVVTFSTKPKLPHKLRQASVEKLFEVFRDVKKLSEGGALAEALRTEQEMYAESPGRVEYRTAVTTKLKDMRK